MKTHLEQWVYGGSEAKSSWKRENIVANKVKFCDGLMLGTERRYDFVKATEDVSCKRCLKKIERHLVNNIDLPIQID